MTSPSAVSASLRLAGYRPLPSGSPLSREGVRVEKAPIRGSVLVTVDTGLTSRNEELAAGMTTALEAAGFTVERRGLDWPTLWVSR